MSEIQVFDWRADNDPSFDLVPRIETFEDLQAYFGVEVDTRFGKDRAGAGQRYYGLYAFYLRTGIASIISKTQDQNGGALPNRLMWVNWPGAPAEKATDPKYFEHAIPGWTNGEGDLGTPYGGEGVVTDGKGPYNIWVNPDPTTADDPALHSDCAKYIGWFGGTNHLTPSPIFRLFRKGSEGNGDVIGLQRIFIGGVEVGVQPIYAPSSGGDNYSLIEIEGVAVGHIPIVRA